MVCSISINYYIIILHVLCCRYEDKIKQMGSKAPDVIYNSRNKTNIPIPNYTQFKVNIDPILFFKYCHISLTLHLKHNN